MVSLTQIDLKLQNSFLNIKKDMDSFRNTLEKQDERIRELERELNSLPGYKELEKLKEGLNETRTISKKQSNEVMSLTEKIQNLRDDFVLKEELPKDFEERFDSLNSELEEIRKELGKKTKEETKKEEPKGEKKKKEKKEEPEKPKKKIFDKVIDFFAEEE